MVLKPCSQHVLAQCVLAHGVVHASRNFRGKLRPWVVALPAAAQTAIYARRAPAARVDQALAETTFLPIAEVLCHLVRGIVEAARRTTPACRICARPYLWHVVESIEPCTRERWS